MADASKLKGLRRTGLGAPPPPEEARMDLAPEPQQEPPPARPRGAEPAVALAAGDGRSLPHRTEMALPANRVDGRTIRRSGRTMQFATRVSPEFDERIRRIAVRDRLLLVEVLERALDAYEVNYKKGTT